MFTGSMCKVLENRSQQDEERMDQLTNQLKEARLLAEDADGKSDEVSVALQYYYSYTRGLPTGEVQGSSALPDHIRS